MRFAATGSGRLIQVMVLNKQQPVPFLAPYYFTVISCACSIEVTIFVTRASFYFITYKNNRKNKKKFKSKPLPGRIECVSSLA